MDAGAIRRHIESRYADCAVTANDYGTFFLVVPDEKFPFATMIDRDDAWDNLSKLDRGGLFRLNIGLGRDTFRAMFGPPAEVEGKGFDYAALDTLFPNPLYHRQHFVSVINPSDATYARLLPLLDEAHDIAAKRVARGAQSREEE
jgi:hypothetical protein